MQIALEQTFLWAKAEEKELFKIIEGCQLRDVIAAHGAGLEAVLEENGKNLSDGQKQRIAIARALIRNPKILLLDESTSHLDMETEEKIFNFISREFAQTMCLFSTHRESVIQRCDGSIRIEDGRIIISC